MNGFADLLAGERHGPRYSRAPIDRGLENAIEALQEQLQFANKSLIDERQRVDELLHQLADARTAAMISGCEAAVLRTRLELLTERRPWWRRWLR